MTLLIPLVMPTPVGKFCSLYDPADGTVHAAGFGPVDAVAARLPATDGVDPGATSGRVADPIRAAVTAYFDGDLAAVERVRVEQPGGAFTRRAWDEMRRIRPGRPVTYAGLAARAGNPAAVRAAGAACARNAVALFVPCHRVVRSDGSLGGYQYGLDAKRWLLDYELEHA